MTVASLRLIDNNTFHYLSHLICISICENKTKNFDMNINVEGIETEKEEHEVKTESAEPSPPLPSSTSHSATVAPPASLNDSFSFASSSSSSPSRTPNTKRPLLMCAVCGSGTHYSYYGALVCDPCRTFFRRQVLACRVSLLLIKLLCYSNFCVWVQFNYSPCFVRRKDHVR